MEEKSAEVVGILKEDKPPNPLSQIESLLIEFKEYINHLDTRLQTANNNQQSTLKRKYRYFLTKLQKHQTTERNLKDKFENLECIVEGSPSIQEQKKSIQFIRMVSGETVRKLQALRNKVQDEKETKKAKAKEIMNLRRKINEEKTHFFALKKEQIRLLGEFEMQKKQQKLQNADQRFKRVLMTKTKGSHLSRGQQSQLKTTILTNVENFKDMRLSEGLDKKLISTASNCNVRKNNENVNYRRKFSETQPGLQKKCMLSTLDQVCLMKESLRKEVEAVQKRSSEGIQVRYEQFMNNWDNNFHKSGLKWWFKHESQNKQGKKRQSKKDCQGCQRKEQDERKSNLKYSLHLRQLQGTKNQESKYPRRTESLQFPCQEDLIVKEEELLKLQQKQRQKEQFLRLPAEQIIKIVSKAGKIYQLSKLIEKDLGSGKRRWISENKGTSKPDLIRS